MNETSHEQQPLDVLRDQPEVRGAVPEQAGGQQRLLARALASADVEEEPDQERGSGGQQHRHQHGVVVGLQDPEHHEEHADRRQDRAERVEGTRRVGRQRDRSIRRLSRTISATTAAWKTNAARQLIAVVMSPPISGPAAAPMPPMPADDAERPRARGEVAEPQRGEDVDGRDQQRRADALEHRVAEDQHAEPRRDRAQQRADPVQHEADGEAALAAPAIGQLAARDHQDRP